MKEHGPLSPTTLSAGGACPFWPEVGTPWTIWQLIDEFAYRDLQKFTPVITYGPRACPWAVGLGFCEQVSGVTPNHR